MVKGNTKAKESDAYSEEQVTALVYDGEDAGEEEKTDAPVPKGEKNYTISCDLIRRNINMLFARKEMTQAHFLHAIGDVSMPSYLKFMSQMGKDKGRDNTTYWGACAFFEDREAKERAARKIEKEQQKELKSSLKKRKHGDHGGYEGGSGFEGGEEDYTVAFRQASTVDSSSSAGAAVSDPTAITNYSPSSSAAVGATTSSSPNAPSGAGNQSRKQDWVKPEIDLLIDHIQATQIPGDDADRVLDDCDEVRRKIALFIEEECGSITKFSFAIRTTPAVVNRFLARKGRDQGAGSDVYKKSYFFFEKLRLLRNQPKSEHRLQSEAEVPQGYNLKNPKNSK